jgi:hypothetical protein
VYRVPFRSLAHLIRPDEQPLYAHREWISKYVAAIDDRGRPKLDLRWTSARTFEISGPVPAGHDVVAAVTSDSGWRATQDGKPVDVTSNKMNFIVAKARPAAASVLRFEYRGTPEQRGMAVLSAFVWAGMLRFVWRQRLMLLNCSTSGSKH